VAPVSPSMTGGLTGTTPPASPGPTASAAVPYSVRSQTVSKGKVHIQYPQIGGMADAGKQEKINTLIKNDVWDANVGESLKLYPFDQISYTIKYQVMMQTDRLLSINYTGKAYITGAAFPTNVLYTLTIDLNTMKKLKLSDFVPVDIDLVHQIENAAHVTDYYGNPLSREDWQAELDQGSQKATDEMTMLNLRDGAENSFYLTEVGLVIGLIGHHAGGDYVWVMLPGPYVESYVNTHA